MVNQLVYALLAIPMILLIATSIYTNFSTNVDQTGWSTEANATKTAVDTGTWNGFTMGSQLPFIYIAVTVISLVLGAFGLSRVF